MSSNMLKNNLMGLDRNRIEQLVREAVVTQLGGTPAKATTPVSPTLYWLMFLRAMLM